MIYLYFDTETTDMVQHKLDPTHESQPLPVQLAALLIEDGVEHSSMNVIIDPNDISIHPEAAKVHGISEELATRLGIRLVDAYSLFTGLVSRCDEVVAHNISFDSIVMRRSMDYLGYVADPFKARPLICTMLQSMDIVKLPGKYGNYKWPSLNEAYQFFFNETFEGAHDALVDVRACARIHQHLLTRDSS